MIFYRDKKEVDEKRIRSSFQKMKEDLLYLQQELIILRQELDEIKQILKQIYSNRYPTHLQHPTHIPTHKTKNYGLFTQNFHSSIGNEGVPTDRQHIYNRQSDTLKRTFIKPYKGSYEDNIISSKPEEISKISSIASIVDDLKQELKEKFQRLSKQEFVIFSILYALQEEKGFVTYKDIAQHTRLAESSVRDYILRLEHKGIPIIKEKLNNKVVVLRIPRELKDITTLDALSKLKDLNQ